MSLPLTHAGLSAPGISAALDLKFASTLSLTSSSGITPSYSRASTGTYFNASGVLTSAAINAPRFDHTYNGTSWISRGLLVEEQRTNIQIYGQDFSNSNWVKFNSTITSESGIAPDGTNTAWLLKETSANNTHSVYYNNLAVSNGVAYAISFFVKAAGRNWCRVRLGQISGEGCFFDLANGVAGTPDSGVTAFIQNVGNGWFRCSVSKISGATAMYGQVTSCLDGSTESYAGDTSKGIYIWGCQLEAGAFPTSHIPVPSGSAATRSADVCQIYGSDFQSFWNASEGSVAVEYDTIYPLSLASSRRLFIFRDAGNSVRLNSEINTPGLYWETVPAGANILGAYSSSAYDAVRAGYGYKVNDFAITVYGSAVSTDTSVAVPTGITLLDIGNMDGSQYLCGHISRLRYFNKRLTDKQLEDLCRPEDQLKLDLKFSENLSLTPVVGPTPSFSRASTGTYFNSSGVLTSAAINAPRFDHTYDGTSWISKGLLVEEQRTNVIQQSEDFTSAVWLKGNVTVSGNQAVSPDGTQDADLVYPTSSGYRYIESTITETGTGSVYTASVYAKAAGVNWITINGLNDNTSLFTWFNISNGTIGTVGSGVTATITNVGNGWYRCTVSRARTGTVYTWFNLCDGNNDTNVTASGTNGVYLWGAQRELGAFPTSYIPTTTTSVVRSADVCQITGADFSGFYNQSEGSVIADYDRIGVDNSKDSEVFQVTNSSGANQYYLDGQGGNEFSNFYISPTTQASLALGLIKAAGISAKTSVAYRANDFAASRDGGSVVTDTSGTVPTVDRMGIGRDVAANNFSLNGHISRLRYYAIRLPNRLLIAKSQ